MDGQFFPFRSPSGPRSLAAAPGWRCSITCESGRTPPRTFSFGKNGNAHTHEAGRPTRVFRSPAPFCPRTEWCPGLSRIHQPIPALRSLPSRNRAILGRQYVGPQVNDWIRNFHIAAAPSGLRRRRRRAVVLGSPLPVGLFTPEKYHTRNLRSLANSRCSLPLSLWNGAVWREARFIRRHRLNSYFGMSEQRT